MQKSFKETTPQVCQSFFPALLQSYSSLAPWQSPPWFSTKIRRSNKSIRALPQRGNRHPGHLSPYSGNSLRLAAFETIIDHNTCGAIEAGNVRSVFKALLLLTHLPFARRA
jgi:hypothetical protein